MIYILLVMLEIVHNFNPTHIKSSKSTSTHIQALQKCISDLQAAHAAQYQKNKQANPKMGRRPKQTFLQRRYTDSQQTLERMLNIINH